MPQFTPGPPLRCRTLSPTRPPPPDITTLAVFAPGTPTTAYCRQTLYQTLDVFEFNPALPNYRDVWASSDYRSFSAALQPALLALDRSLAQYAFGTAPCHLCGFPTTPRISPAVDT